MARDQFPTVAHEPTVMGRRYWSEQQPSGALYPVADRWVEPGQTHVVVRWYLEVAARKGSAADVWTRYAGDAYDYGTREDAENALAGMKRRGELRGRRWRIRKDESRHTFARVHDVKPALFVNDVRAENSWTVRPSGHLAPYRKDEGRKRPGATATRKATAAELRLAGQWQAAGLVDANPDSDRNRAAFGLPPLPRD